MLHNASRRPGCARWPQICPLLALVAVASLTAADSTNLPPAAARILKIIHAWPDEPDAQDRLIATLQRQGFGGVVCNVSFDQYLESEPHWRAFTRAVKAARQAGLALWLYDERGYPSGNAGGITLRDHPEWEARGLLVADTESGGGPVDLELPPGNPVWTAAYPVRNERINLADCVTLANFIQEGRLKWRAPEGRWRVLAITESRLYEGTHADGNLWQKLPYPNLLMREPTARFVEVTYDAYARNLGTNLGHFFEATFTDEPSLMSLFLRPMPWRPLPWSPDLPSEFKRRRGYTLATNLLPALVLNAQPGDQKIRHDFWLTIGELVSENYFGQIQERCRRYGLPSGGHLLAEEGLVGHVALYGDFFRCIRRLDAPSIDCLTSLPAEVPWYIARLLASAAELEGRRLVMSETSDHSQVYRPAGDQRPKRLVTEAEIRGTCNRQIVAGVNRITSYYSWNGLTDEQLRRLNNWVGRCCDALTGGHQIADIAVLYPAETLWTKFVPSKHWSKDAAEAARVEAVYRAAIESLFAARRDFTFVDSRALIESRAASGRLTHGPLAWRVVVLPATDTLPLAAWEKLAGFVRGGGVVVALGGWPRNSETEFPSPRVQELAREIFGVEPAQPRIHANRAGGAGLWLSAGAEALLPMALDGILAADTQVAPPKSPIRTTHRRIGGREVYFVINDSPQSWTGRISFSAEGPGEKLDPASGLATPVLQAEKIELALEPYGAALFRFARPLPPRRHALQSGALPNLALRPLKEVQPTTPHGEFVQAALQADSALTQPGKPVWQINGKLTRSRVDTFLFAQFRHSPPADLGPAECLVLDTWVPQGQTTANQLLVILHEQDGGDFIANTGRSLAAPGYERCFVPLNQFQLAGWSRDADGQLDAHRISDIRIGWGGYLGREGEEVRFSVALPSLGVLSPLESDSSARRD